MYPALEIIASYLMRNFSSLRHPIIQVILTILFIEIVVLSACHVIAYCLYFSPSPRLQEFSRVYYELLNDENDHSNQPLEDNDGRKERIQSALVFRSIPLERGLNGNKNGLNTVNEQCSICLCYLGTLCVCCAQENAFIKVIIELTESACNCC